MKNEARIENHEGIEGLDTEAGALQHIVSWSEERPMWQRDALRRLCRKDVLSEEDYAALIVIAKGDETAAQPLKHEHVPSPDAAYSTVNLKSICDSKNVNALEPGQVLSFEKGNGITVIYGDNGSGKSGYARILKNACRARMNAKDKQDIKPNIYDQNPGTPQAALNFSVNGQNQTAQWVQNSETDARLSAISVFDSNAANVHVDEENDVAYTPFPLELLRRLSIVCGEMHRRIKQEVDTLTKQTPDSIKNPKRSANTEVGKIVYALKAETAKETIETLAVLSEKEKAEHETLKADMDSDPKKMSRKLSGAKSTLETIMTALQGMIEACALEKIADIQDKQAILEAKKAAAKAAAEDLFTDDAQDKILPNLGAEGWRSLWEAARLYSKQDAYPEKAFPYTEDGAKCVLCQQDLSPEAANRLQSFETFVKDEAKRQEDKARREYNTALNDLETHNASTEKIDDDYKAIRDQIGNEELASAFRLCAIQTKRRIRDFLADQSKDANTLPAAGAVPDYQAALDAIQKRIDDLTAEKDSPKRLAMIQRFNELEDRVWLGIVKNDLLAEIDRIIEKEALGKLLNDTRTNAITGKSSGLAKYLVTDALGTEFAKEIRKLELGDLVKLCHAKSTSGSPLFRVSLTRKPNEKKISAILSEGEFRCIALAAFLAEQATTKSKSTIVFDDPVCSLDHMHREQVADRLALEGRDRQIIVFTHDLAFLFLLEGACERHRASLAHRWILKAGEKVGLCKPDAPLRAQGVEKALDSLENDLKNRKIQSENGDHMQWEATVNHYQKELRTLWERAVEESVAPVVKRLQNKVNTGGLSKVTAITLEDCDAMQKGYGRCSKLLHSDGDSLNRPLPKPEIITNEINAIRDWIKSIKARQKSVIKEKRKNDNTVPCPILCT
jgi:hypothetical protein